MFIYVSSFNFIVYFVIKHENLNTTAWESQTDLRRYAANEKIFKIFFLHPFLASTIYNNTIKNKFDIG